ncbi:hypothetical protein BU26DRAFT_525991 [Trematosphaeria pertusa]|uniref:Nitrogen permease regulator 3 n=1 Tax=Trematosphaeria pertusa TaxID=390896 RepID=A0A6A6HRA0_9PLEO|nr:uncharacterized protein BU26DRAFT_525991 [Trematosphaeria pertusa]KAF2240527.1 hypothetical protein BU26DRAFT_525991 [Trematosphaeria pertusa]
MALPLPPASNLHAILLVTQSRSLGPRLVFHYPPISPSAAALAANKAPVWFAKEATTSSGGSESSSSDWDSSTENEGGDDDAEVGSRTSGGRGSSWRTGASHRDKDKYRPGAGGVWGRSIDEEDGDLEVENGSKASGNGKQKGGIHDWDTVLGFKVDALEKILCPGKAFNKRRFEMGVESVVFVGAPMFVREDGLWKKRKKRRKRSAEDALLANLKIGEAKKGDGSPEEDRSGSTSTEPFVYPEGFEPGYGHGLISGAPSGAVSEAGSDARSNSTADNNPDMTMFNVVFVLNPPALEYQLRVKDMYDNISRKYAKALKYEQARFQYVWKESKRIIDIKQRAKENGEALTATWQKILAISPLAKSIAILFEAISNDKIAHVHFDATFNTSFQIPQADSTPYLPNALEPQMPGLWLTTSNVVIEDESDAPMTQHAALLLLEDPETLIKDLEGDNKNNTAALAFYIRNIIPTKSLLKISNKHNIVAQDMEYIASHLVYWRRARLIAPLHPRDTYIVSPNADLSNLQAAIPAYASRFSTLPTLPKMLSMLSGTPKPYRSFIPTAEHREAYMDILAWLMRGGWVTQLRTFAWVRVSPEIKAQVAADMEREERVKKADDLRREAASDNGSMTESLLSDKRSSLLSASTIRPATPLRRTRRDRDGEEEGTETNAALSPLVAATGWRGSPARASSSDAGSTSSARTTIALSSGAQQRPISPAPPSHSRDPQQQQRPQRPSPLHLKTTSPSRPQPFSPTSPSLTATAAAGPPQSPPPSPQSFAPSLILNPQKANSTEARWLEKIGQTFAHDADLREHWPMLLRHLDGRHAIEDISPREGLKRKRVAALFNGVREGGWLVVVRHW